MRTTVGSTVHPWYKGVHEWKVKNVAELVKPIEYRDPTQGQVRYDPKMMWLESNKIERVLWFPYWMATSKTKDKMRWGGGSPMLEEGIFLELMKDAIGKGLFSKEFLHKLGRELRSVLK